MNNHSETLTTMLTTPLASLIGLHSGGPGARGPADAAQTQFEK